MPYSSSLINHNIMQWRALAYLSSVENRDEICMLVFGLLNTPRLTKKCLLGKAKWIDVINETFLTSYFMRAFEWRKSQNTRYLKGTGYYAKTVTLIYLSKFQRNQSKIKNLFCSTNVVPCGVHQHKMMNWLAMQMILNKPLWNMENAQENSISRKPGKIV